MAVNTWERELSKIAFLWQTHLLNQEISDITAKTPAKYKNSYDEFIIHAGLSAFEKLYIANSYMVNEYTSDTDFRERRRLLREGMAQLNICASTLTIYFEHLRNADGVNQDKVDRLNEKFGTKIADIISLVRNVIKSDERRQGEYKEKRKAAKQEQKQAS